MKISGILKYTAIAVSAAILFIACEEDDFIDDDSAIVSLSADGSIDAATTKLIFTVKDNNFVLTADDIKINAKNFSVIKGILTKKGTIYELLITSGSTDKIRVGLDPYRGFTGWVAKAVNVYADWYFSGTENLTITGYNQSIIDPSETQIPAEIAEKPVTAIGYRAFYYKELTNVSFSADIKLKDIGNSAFAYNQLSKITIPDGVVSIGRTSFAYNQLSEVIIPDSVTAVGYGAFAYNQLNSVNIINTVPGKITSIEGSAFRYNRITAVTIPASVKNIEDYAFDYNKLENIIIPSGVRSIGDGAFGNNQLKEINIPNSVVSLSGFNDNKLEKKITIPNSVGSIGNNAFANNKLKEVDIPDNVKTIGSYAFAHNEITSVTISNKITTIEPRTFAYNKLAEIVIPDNVRNIGIYAFMENPLTSITIGKNVTLGSSAFGNGFESFYYNNSRKEGTYTLSDDGWEYAAPAPPPPAP